MITETGIKPVIGAGSRYVSRHMGHLGMMVGGAAAVYAGGRIADNSNSTAGKAAGYGLMGLGGYVGYRGLSHMGARKLFTTAGRRNLGKRMMNLGGKMGGLDHNAMTGLPLSMMGKGMHSAGYGMRMSGHPGYSFDSMRGW